jgi:hypothetical protein
MGDFLTVKEGQGPSADAYELFTWDPSRFDPVRAHMNSDNDPAAGFSVEHIDVTCDGCEVEPIVGPRYQCGKCEDRDLCGRCYGALLEARAVVASAGPSRPVETQTWRPGLRMQRGGAGTARMPKTTPELARARKLAALRGAVPCLDPSHVFHKMEGPERQPIFYLKPAGAGAVAAAAGVGTAAAAVDESAAAVAAAASEGATAAEVSPPQPVLDLEGFLDLFPPSGCASRDLAYVCIRTRARRARGAGAAAGSAAGPAEEEDPHAYDPPEDAVDALCEAFDALVDLEEGGADDKKKKKKKKGRRKGQQHQQQHQQQQQQQEGAGAAQQPQAAEGPPPPAVTEDAIKALALKHGVVGGKWMVYPREGTEADAAWRAAAVALREGLFGDESWIKITSVSPGMMSHVLFVYIKDFTDAAAVARVGKALDERVMPHLKDKRRTFKPDAYSILQIYKGNPWGIKPSLNL